MPARDPALAMIGTVERILHLKRLPTLGTLPAPDLGVVADQTRECHFSRGETLLREGEPVGAIYFVLEGSVRITRRGRPVGQGGPGTAVGGLGLLARDPKGIGAEAISEVFALELEADALVELCEDHFSILHHILRETCGQLIDLQRRSPLRPSDDVARFTPLAPASRDLDLVERIFLLRQAPPFRRSSINALAELSRFLTEVRFDAGLTLWREGDPASWLLLVVNGSVACSPASGHVLHLGPRAPLGVLESLAGRPRWCEAVTETKVVALQGQPEGLIDVFEDNVEMAMDYLALMSRWLLAAVGPDPELRRFTIGALVAEQGPRNESS